MRCNVDSMGSIPGINAMTKNLEALQERQSEVLQLSSKIIRLAGRMITLIHADEMAEVAKLKRELSKEIAHLSKIEKDFEYYTIQAHQEYVEASVFSYIVKGKKIPTKGELMEKAVPYLLGIMDVVGELKREALDELMAKNREKAMEYYGIMKSIYDSTLHMRFANSIMPGFRRKQDTARIQLESVAAELV